MGPPLRPAAGGHLHRPERHRAADRPGAPRRAHPGRANAPAAPTHGEPGGVRLRPAGTGTPPAWYDERQRGGGEPPAPSARARSPLSRCLCGLLGSIRCTDLAPRRPHMAGLGRGRRPTGDSSRSAVRPGVCPAGLGAELGWRPGGRARGAPACGRAQPEPLRRAGECLSLGLRAARRGRTLVAPRPAGRSDEQHAALDGRADVRAAGDAGARAGAPGKGDRLVSGGPASVRNLRHGASAGGPARGRARM